MPSQPCHARPGKRNDLHPHACGLPKFSEITTNIQLDRYQRIPLTNYMKKTFCLSLAILAASFAGCAHFNGTKADATAAGWDMVPEILGRIVPPTFPAREFDITQSGAVGDGQTDCTEAI